jgi:hypothetical protein
MMQALRLQALTRLSHTCDHDLDWVAIISHLSAVASPKPGLEEDCSRLVLQPLSLCIVA